MKKLYSKLLLYTAALLPLCALGSVDVYAIANSAFGDSLKVRSNITDTRPDKPFISKSSFKVNFTPFKPSVIKSVATTSAAPVQSTAKTSIQADDNSKVLSNVKIYPNPISDQFNLSYHVNKDANVSIKIMDVLGNEISTLLSAKVQAGEKLNSFSIGSKLNSGFYFIRMMVGNETVVKRISVL